MCNRVFVCPDNLEEALSREIEIEDRKRREKMIAVKRQEEERREAYALAQLEREAQAQPNYVKAHKKYLGIVFGNENIHFSVLQSIEEFKDEGVAMNNCVFRCKYYEKPNSVILSCKDSQGNRLETIEIDVKNLAILQARGYANGISKQHDEILALLKANLYLFNKKQKKAA